MAGVLADLPALQANTRKEVRDSSLGIFGGAVRETEVYVTQKGVPDGGGGEGWGGGMGGST